MSSQPPMEGHLAIPQNDNSYTNKPPMSSHLPLKATFPVSQGWLLIAGSTVVYTLNSGLSVNNNAFYTRKPIGILYKSQRFQKI